MDGELMGLFIFTFGGIGAVLAYVIWRHVSEARATDRQQAKERRWATAFGMPETTLPASNTWNPVVMLCGALVLSGALFWWNLDGESEESPRRELTVAERYPGPWRSDYRVDIQRVLSAAGAGKCFFYYREATVKGEFLAYCPPDETRGNWRAYLVWPLIGKAIGPHAPDPTITLPTK